MQRGERTTRARCRMTRYIPLWVPIPGVIELIVLMWFVFPAVGLGE